MHCVRGLEVYRHGISKRIVCGKEALSTTMMGVGRVNLAEKGLGRGGEVVQPGTKLSRIKKRRRSI